MEDAKIVYRNYIRRFFIHPVSQSVQLPESDLYLVLPSYLEPDVEKTLDDLARCRPTEMSVCVLVVFNHPASEPVERKREVEDQRQKLKELLARAPWIAWHSVWIEWSHEKNAGVGLARKIGMDAVIWNIAETGSNPILLCLDGDCRVSEFYLEALEHSFHRSSAQVATLEFEHQTDPGSDPRLVAGILQYEAFLEYYRLGLAWAGFPFFGHTVGSSMACKALAYARSGGMNQRKAGEDFYFLHKLFPHYETVEIPGPHVFPSPRISARVPFGTGRFQAQWNESTEAVYKTYHPETFQILRIFLEECRSFLFSNDREFSVFKRFEESHPHAAEYWIQGKVEEILLRAKGSSARNSIREKSFFTGFDGLKALRFIHFFQSHFSAVSPAEGISRLLPSIPSETDPKECVRKVRTFLREFPFS